MNLSDGIGRHEVLKISWLNSLRGSTPLLDKVYNDILDN